MLFLLNGDGTMTRLDSGRIFQGSNNFTELGVIYPFSGVTLSVAFTLPNGIDTDYTPMPSLEPYTLRGNNGETKVFENLYYTSTRIPATVTAMQGDVKVTVLATAAADVGGSTNPTQGTSFAATFTVEYAALPVYTVPDDPTEADFQKLVELLTAYQGTISGNVTELQNRMTTAEGNITSLGERVTTAEGEIDDLQERMTAAEGNIEQAQENIIDLQSGKQDKTDNALKTPDKTVVGAINEIYDELTDTTGTGFASRLDTAEAEINVLDSRVDDVEEKTKDPLMTDFTVDVATSTATKFYNNGTQADVTLPTGDTAERINFLTSAVFTDEHWAEQSDGTYALTLPASQTGRTNNKYVANLEVTDGSVQVVSADKFLKNEDGSITLKDFSEPWSGRVITVAAGQHGSIIHFGTAVTGAGEQTSADLELRAAAMVGDVYINTNTFENYTCVAVSSTTSTWKYEGTNKGATGSAATIAVGDVETLPEGSNATVENTGNANSAVFKFGIPRGATGATGNGIQSISYTSTAPDGSFVYTITFTNGGTTTFTAPRGQQGAKGDTGEPFAIYKTYTSVAAMNADAENVPDGRFVLIETGNVDDEDNSKMYVRTVGGEADFQFVTDLSGAQGIKGDRGVGIQSITFAQTTDEGNAYTVTLTDGSQSTIVAPKGEKGDAGAAATVQVGTVTTLDAGEQATVTNSGTTEAAVLNFGIPKGAAGNDGANGTTFTPSVDTNGDLSWTNDGGLPNPETVNVKGAQGEAATVQVGETTTLPAGSQATVNNSGSSGAAVLNFGIPTGQPGADGQAATIAVGEVTTGAAGSQASVTNSGTGNAAVLDFTIPQGADGASGVTDVTAGTPTEQDGYTVTPVTFSFEQGNSKTVNVQAKNGAQQNNIINRTASVDTADANSPDFVENGNGLWVKKITGYETEVTTLEATLPSARRYASAATAPNGKIYIFGGDDRGGALDGILEFDPVARAVTTLEATLPSAREGTSAATAPNGKIYVFGGNTLGGGSYVNDILEFDPVTQTVRTLEATLWRGRGSTSAATAPNGKIYIFGGYYRTSATPYLDDIVEFDPVAQTVRTLEATLPSGRRSTSAATAPNGKIYIFGGTDGGDSYLDDIVEFDPVAQTVTTLDATLPSARSRTSAATASSGKIYVFGGYYFRMSGSSYLNDILEFDPVAQSVTTLGATLPSVRCDTSAATAPNGKICVLGGYTESGVLLDDIVEFDPPAAQYAYSPAVVLSQEEYAQFKNILNGIFSVGISAPSAAVSGTLEAGNTTVNGTLTATGDISTVGGATVGANLSVMGNASASSFNATT